MKRIIRALVALFRTPAPVAALPAPKEIRVWDYIVTRTRGNYIQVVDASWIAADSPSAALALIALRGLAHPGEAVEIDGRRYRMWASARPTPIDPAKRANPGDRRRDRERGVAK